MYTLTLSSKAPDSLFIGNILLTRKNALTVEFIDEAMQAAITAGSVEASDTVVEPTALAGDLTDSTGGTPNVLHILVDVTATPTQALINDNFATLAVRIVALNDLVNTMIARNAELVKNIENLRGRTLPTGPIIYGQ